MLGRALGVWLSRLPAQCYDHERHAEVQRLLRRMLLLPRNLPQVMRRKIVVMAITPKCTWGGVLNGNYPTQAVQRQFWNDSWRAVKGRTNAAGREARPLMRAFAWGPAFDYMFALVMRTHRAIARWNIVLCVHILGYLQSVYWGVPVGRV